VRESKPAPLQPLHESGPVAIGVEAIALTNAIDSVCNDVLMFISKYAAGSLPAQSCTKAKALFMDDLLQCRLTASAARPVQRSFSAEDILVLIPRLLCTFTPTLAHDQSLPLA